MSFELRTDVPMPGARNTYPFKEMAPGTMFEILGDEDSRRIRNAAYQYAKKLNKDAAVAAAVKAKGAKLTSNEKAAVVPLQKGDPGYVAFALRKVSQVTEAGDVVEKDAKAPEGETYTPVFGLWRTH